MVRLYSPLCICFLALGVGAALDATKDLQLIRSTFLAASNRVVIYQFEAERNRWLDFALNMYWQLENKFPLEFLALGSFSESCEALGKPRCVTNSLPEHGTPQRPDVHGFWAARYNFFTRLVDSGMDVLMIDADMQVHGNVFTYLDNACVARASMAFHAEGGGPNGGTAWARGSGPHAVASWLFGSVARLYPLFLESEKTTGKAPCSTMDQDFLKDALSTALMPNSSQWDLRNCRRDGVKEHEFWRDKPKVPDYAPAGVSVMCENTSLFEVYLPRDVDGAPATQLAHWFPLEFTSFAGSGRPPWPPSSKLTHMLGASGIWMPTFEEAKHSMSHVSRQAMMQIDGYWAPEVYLKYARTKRLLFIDDTLVSRVEDDIVVLRHTLADALLEAANAGRVLVLPQISCSARWIQPNDPRVLWRAHDGACFVGAHSYEFCWPWDYVAYAFDNIVDARRRLPAALGDVVVNHFSNTTAHAGVMRECADFFR